MTKRKAEGRVDATLRSALARLEGRQREVLALMRTSAGFRELILDFGTALEAQETFAPGYGEVIQQLEAEVIEALRQESEKGRERD